MRDRLYALFTLTVSLLAAGTFATVGLISLNYLIRGA